MTIFNKQNTLNELSEMSFTSLSTKASAITNGGGGDWVEPWGRQSFKYD